MWTYLGKQITIAINIQQIQCIQFNDGTEQQGFHAIKSFNRGIFVNPTLDKKKYLSLLKVFHPDVSDLDGNLATQIAQAINNAKDGMPPTTSPWKTNHQSPSPREAESSASSSNNHSSWWQQYDWANSTTQKKSRSQGDRQKQKPPEVELNFETLLSHVPTNYWKIFGAADTFERDTRVNFRIFKRCYYGYFDTELEIVFRKGCIYRERLVAIHSNSLYILNQLDLNNLTKKDLWTLCDYEIIPYTKFRHKDELVKNIQDHLNDRSKSLENQLGDNSWTLMITSPRPLWKHKFIKCDYHDNFEQFDRTNKSKKQQQESYDRQAKADTSNYFNCGQYLKLLNQWLERDDFLHFLELTRKLAKKLDIKTTIEDGYPAYPIEILDLAWQKISL